ncbi:hydrolase, TatD family protein, putative [Cordyceps militaris CM01]|uniref:Hydrolase, TatD family protein, putative n=1 Tax=Cordyceps militaris (strain CM01) TaxID=983644 RepID=G3J7Z4_CORMM|nr:hydrolase, TatD family protein, putative [Cordyceps militaris CM01]EGX97205.1 hydrolase, TatD family protein, putative [Cordyceps militaris CM01]
MVRRLVLAKQLLDFNLKDRWEPLCKVLDVPAPDVPFPRIDEEAQILSMLRGLGCGYELEHSQLSVSPQTLEHLNHGLVTQAECMTLPTTLSTSISLFNALPPKRFKNSAIHAMTIPEPASEPLAPTYNPRYVDIGINLADRVYRGQYRGNQKHPDDLEAVVDRAKQVGCTKLLVTGSDWHSIQDAADLAKEYQKSATHMARLKKLLQDAKASNTGHLIAFGEFGLDYDRLHFCNKAVQLHSFAAQLKLAAAMEPQLPLFLHSRAAAADFARLLKDAFGARLERLARGGVVHSFTGSSEEMRELLDLGLYIGINGCSLKTEENCAVVRELPLDRLMLETDGPWCEVRPSHAGWKYLIEKSEPASAEETPSTPASDAAEGVVTNGTGKRHKPQKQPNHGKKKNQKAEPEVPSRFKATKNWQEGCMIKGRNEPCTIERIAKIVAGIQGVSVEEVCEAAWRNTNKVFDLGESV